MKFKCEWCEQPPDTFSIVIDELDPEFLTYWAECKDCYQPPKSPQRRETFITKEEYIIWLIEERLNE